MPAGFRPDSPSLLGRGAGLAPREREKVPASAAAEASSAPGISMASREAVAGMFLHTPRAVLTMQGMCTGQ